MRAWCIRKMLPVITQLQSSYKWLLINSNSSSSYNILTNIAHNQLTLVLTGGNKTAQKSSWRTDGKGKNLQFVEWEIYWCELNVLLTNIAIFMGSLKQPQIQHEGLLPLCRVQRAENLLVHFCWEDCTGGMDIWFQSITGPGSCKKGNLILYGILGSQIIPYSFFFSLPNSLLLCYLTFF